jgi:hypothetical protein
LDSGSWLPITIDTTDALTAKHTGNDLTWTQANAKASYTLDSGLAPSNILYGVPVIEYQMLSDVPDYPGSTVKVGFPIVTDPDGISGLEIGVLSSSLARHLVCYPPAAYMTLTIGENKTFGVRGWRKDHNGVHGADDYWITLKIDVENGWIRLWFLGISPGNISDEWSAYHAFLPIVALWANDSPFSTDPDLHMTVGQTPRTERAFGSLLVETLGKNIMNTAPAVASGFALTGVTAAVASGVGIPVAVAAGTIGAGAWVLGGAARAANCAIAYYEHSNDKVKSLLLGLNRTLKNVIGKRFSFGPDVRCIGDE